MTHKNKTPLGRGAEDCCSLNSSDHYTAALEVFERIALALERSNALARESNVLLETIAGNICGVSNRLEDLGGEI